MKAAASLYGVDMVLPTRPTRRIASRQRQGRALPGLCGNRPRVPANVIPDLDTALKAAGTKYRMETYKGVHHGFVFPCRPDYDPVAAEESWTRVVDLWDRNLK